MKSKKIFNFGSLNIDHVYRLNEFVKPGETLLSLSYEKVAGGKGLNQSIALARANANVLHAGKIGEDGIFLKQILEQEFIDCSFIEVSNKISTGHAIIQVNDKGQNCIILHGGTNQTITDSEITQVFATAEKGDYLVLQNEINSLDLIIKTAHEKGMKIFFNIAPMNEKAKSYPINLVDTIVLNETEAEELRGVSSNDYNEVISTLNSLYPTCNILLTLGSNGAAHYDRENNKTIYLEATDVQKVIDSTAAGDTFMGYFVAGLSEGSSYQNALELATEAAGITITNFGAAQSIPYRKQLTK